MKGFITSNYYFMWKVKCLVSLAIAATSPPPFHVFSCQGVHSKFVSVSVVSGKILGARYLATMGIEKK